MYKTITLTFILLFLSSFIFSQTEKPNLDSLTLEEELENWYYQNMEDPELDTFEKVEEEEESIEEEGIFKIPIEDIPVFPACKHLMEVPKEMKNCTQQKIVDFIYANLQYPPEAIAQKTEGEVSLRFLVDRRGRVSKVEILEDIGNGCGEAAKRALLLLNKEKPWRRSKSRDRVVRIRYILPITFKLNSKLEPKN